MVMEGFKVNFSLGAWTTISVIVFSFRPDEAINLARAELTTMGILRDLKFESIESYRMEG